MASIGPREMAGKIFINYRRRDDEGFAGRLCDQLEQAFGRKQVFMDVDSNLDGARRVEARRVEATMRRHAPTLTQLTIIFAACAACTDFGLNGRAGSRTAHPFFVESSARLTTGPTSNVARVSRYP